MKTCEFCQFGTDECLLLKEPIEYESSGMTHKENCPVVNIQVSRPTREVVHGKDQQNMVCTTANTKQNKESDREV